MVKEGIVLELGSCKVRLEEEGWQLQSTIINSWGVLFGK
jgi:hypothetical protein